MAMMRFEICRSDGAQILLREPGSREWMPFILPILSIMLRISQRPA